MKVLFKTISLMTLWIVFPSVAQKDSICKTDPQRCPFKPEKVEFVGSVSFLSQTEAKKIWNDIQTHIKELEALCPSQKKKKTFQTDEWVKKIRQMGQKAGKVYKENQYSFNKVKVLDGGKKVDLGVTLLDMESILTSEYIQYKSKDQPCKDLKDGFASGYASHYNIQDSEDVIKALSPWAKKIYGSLICFCP